MFYIHNWLIEGSTLSSDLGIDITMTYNFDAQTLSLSIIKAENVLLYNISIAHKINT